MSATVPNSPSSCCERARTASIAYGLDLTLVLLPGNAGFGAANNAAVGVSRTGRTLIVNPDVFPLDADWAVKHGAVLAGAACRRRRRLFGAPLYYDDGSMMHAGMYFDSDASVAMDGARFAQNVTLRVEHYGKGAPPLASEFLRSRPVPAVTGAFISCDRGWFEKLGGFSEEYVLGHYEDADLCLKSIGQGVAPWIHDIKLWHLEGKGSTKRQATHEGASIVNRWLFSKRWSGAIIPEMLGQKPRHPLLQVEDVRPLQVKPPMPAARPLRSRRRQRAPAPPPRNCLRRGGISLMDGAIREQNGRASRRAPTKVLLISLFHPELVRGGAQQVCYELFQGLRSARRRSRRCLPRSTSSMPALYKSGARITGFDRRPNEFLFLSRDYDYTWHKAAGPAADRGLRRVPQA